MFFGYFFRSFALTSTVFTGPRLALFGAGLCIRNISSQLTPHQSTSICIYLFI